MASRRLALVTGATGLVGSYLVEQLLADGWGVRALVRDLAATDWLSRMGAECTRGDILNATSVAHAAAGCHTIFHAAALVTPHGGWEVFRRANVDGTANVIRAATESGARLLHVSSVAVYGAAARFSSTPTDEDVPFSPLPHHAFYARSKREAEESVLEAHARGTIWATTVRPDVIYGKRDRQFVPRVARVLRHGIAPLIGGGGTTLAIVHAANVADGAVRAAAFDQAGGRAYNLANDYDVTVKEFFQLAGLGLGVRVRLVPVPLSLARAGLRLAGLSIAVVKGPALAAQAAGTFSFLTRDNPFSSDRARRELAWSPPMKSDVGIPEAFRSWREAGHK
ncbi:MAG: NAD-dependent epimerase/dehydratase family protein [Gemmatimonadaceae bacterium]